MDKLKDFIKEQSRMVIENSKKSSMKVTEFNPSESWSITPHLRYVENSINETTLQQMWQGSNGTQKWETVEIIKEEANEEESLYFMEWQMTFKDGQEILFIEKELNKTEMGKAISKLCILDSYFFEQGWNQEYEMRRFIADIIQFISK